MRKQIALICGLPLLILIFSGMFIVRYKHSLSFRTAFLSTIASLMFYLATLFPGLAQAIDHVETVSPQPILKNREQKNSSCRFGKRKQRGGSKPKAVTRSIDDLHKTDNRKTSKSKNARKVQIFLQEDIPLLTKITNWENLPKTSDIKKCIFTDGVIEENLLIEKGLRHIVEEPIKIKAEKPKYKKFNRKIHTIAELPKQRGDIIISRELKNIPHYDSTNQEKFLTRKVVKPK